MCRKKSVLRKAADNESGRGCRAYGAVGKESGAKCRKSELSYECSCSGDENKSAGWGERASFYGDRQLCAGLDDVSGRL